MHLVLLASLAACVDYDIHFGKPDLPFDDGDSVGPIDTAVGSTPPPPDEVCNGVDDDGDGEVDEGFPDTDGNGRADCLDGACPDLDVGAAGPIPVSGSCTGSAKDPVADPWNVEVAWTYDGNTWGMNGSAVTPLVGPLFDTDGNGVVDADDDAMVVVGVWAGPGEGAVSVLDGVTGAEVASYRDFGTAWPVGLGDVDADGSPDILTFDERYNVVALDADGSLKWTATRPTALSPLLTAVDLEGDGQPEVLAGDLVIDGTTGATRFWLPPVKWTYAHSTAADVDGDGDQEIAWNGALFDSDGTLLWDTGARADYVAWPAVVQADGDDDPEFVFIASTHVLADSDGTVLATAPVVIGEVTSPPCVADFDGDGDAEVAYSNNNTLWMRELDGATLWSKRVTDWGAAGCSGFDVDASGTFELLYADEEDFRVLDGATGDVLYEDAGHGSGTSIEYPSIVDLDRDGHAEILYVSNEAIGPAEHALTVLTHAGGGWPAAGTTWGAHDYTIGCLETDLGVPTARGPFWLTDETFRAHTEDVAAPDLRVTITDVCVADCDLGPVQVAVQVANVGDADGGPGTVELYAVDGGITRLVASAALEPIPSGSALDGTVFDLAAADVGTDGFEARVRLGRVAWDCDPANDVATWRDGGCP